MRIITVACAALLLAGCVAKQVDVPLPAPRPSAPVTKPLDLKPICGQVKVYTDAESKALAAAAVALDPASILITALADYARMRAEARACMAKG